jgi:hypothetical protein
MAAFLFLLLFAAISSPGAAAFTPVFWPIEENPKIHRHLPPTKASQSRHS